MKKKKYSLRIRMMEINVGIALVSFLLCGVLFILSTSFLIRKYINYDLDFFLKETGNSIERRMEYIERTVTGIRKSEGVMRYFEDESVEGLLEIQKAFMREVDINASSNQGEKGMPIVEKVYLFQNTGEYISDFYYALVPEEVEKSDEIARNVWNVYKSVRKEAIGFEAYYYRNGSRLYLTCPILDKNMVEKGSVIFEVNLESVRGMMAQVSNYEDAFWGIYEENGKILEVSPGSQKLTGTEWKNTLHEEPYLGKIDGREYRMYNKELCLNMRVVIGIPEGYVTGMLCDYLDIYIIGIVMIFAVGILSFGVFTYKMTAPIEEVNRKIRQVESGDFEAKLPDYNNQEFHEISRGFNQMTKAIDNLIHEVYEKQLRVREMELKFLQTQMNPHFMFNVLNALALQARMDGNKNLSEKISIFSQLIQAKIYRNDTEKVKIRQELEYVKYYLEIQKFRYGDGLSYSIEMEEGLDEFYIPKLCIQLVTENAVVHGLEPKMGNGHVDICIEKKDYIQITVTDDGVGFDVDGEIALPLQATKANQEHNRVGLNNADSIIKLMYGKEFGIHIYSIKGSGTKVIVCIPFDSGEEKETFTNT